MLIRIGTKGGSMSLKMATIGLLCFQVQAMLKVLSSCERYMFAMNEHSGYAE